MSWEWVKELFGFEGARDGKYYVYELIDPRFGLRRVFYVGKGTGNRMFQHEKDMRRALLSDYGIQHMQPKHKRILEILDSGSRVEYEVVFRTNNEEEAYQVESKRIRLYGLEHLCNETYGYNEKKVRMARATIRVQRQTRKPRGRL